VTLDAAGTVYLTTRLGGGGLYDDGTVVSLTYRNGEWKERKLYSFGYVSNKLGVEPVSGVIVDQSGSLYGTTSYIGTVFRLSPSESVGTVLHSFQCYSDGGDDPRWGLIFDQLGNIYGASSACGAMSGSIFKMTPEEGGWAFTVVYAFAGGRDGLNPKGLVLDANGNIYGTAESYYTAGKVFKLSPSEGDWVYTSLYDFTGGSDGGAPRGSLVLDNNGNLYGTTSENGAYGCGVVWEITP
jgi:hypothetical protein